MARRQEGFIKAVMLRRDLVRSFERYPYATPAIASLETLALDPSATFLVGGNGSGKSTFLEALAVAAGLNAEGGSRNLGLVTRPSHSELGNTLRLVRSGAAPQGDFFLRAESFYNVATEIEALGVEGYGDVPLHEQSHGESFLALALNRFWPDGLYLLDEPEAALSPQGQLALLLRLHELVEDGCQLVVATHSPILVALPDALIYAFDEAGVRRVDYDDVEAVQLYRDFLADPGRYVHHLLAEAPETDA